MNYVKAAAGALAIMMASGMIADFDLSEQGNDVYVIVWSVGDQPEARLRKHVAALLPDMIDETHIIVVRDQVA